MNLAEQWKDEPESYMSVAAADMPNYFLMMGPNAVVGHGSLVEALNWTGDYFCEWIKKIAAENIKSFIAGGFGGVCAVLVGTLFSYLVMSRARPR